MITVIIGHPTVGKTTYAKENYKDIIHTDDFIGMYSWEEMPEKLFNMIKDKKDIAIEGVAGFRLLRTALRDYNWVPDKVIVLYRANFKPKPKHIGMCKSNEKVFDDFLNMNPTCEIEYKQIKTR